MKLQAGEPPLSPDGHGDDHDHHDHHDHHDDQALGKLGPRQLGQSQTKIIIKTQHPKFKQGWSQMSSLLPKIPNTQFKTQGRTF